MNTDFQCSITALTVWRCWACFLLLRKKLFSRFSELLLAHHCLTLLSDLLGSWAHLGVKIFYLPFCYSSDGPPSHNFMFILYLFILDVVYYVDSLGAFISLLMVSDGKYTMNASHSTSSYGSVGSPRRSNPSTKYCNCAGFMELFG